MFKRLKKNKKGTSLVELVIYIAISSIILTEVIGILSQVVYNQTRIQAISREDENARTIMRLVSESVQEAGTINSPNSLNASASTLNLTDSSGNTIVYSLTSGIVYKKVNSAAAIAISSNDVYVPTLTFTVESEAGESPSINIKLYIQQSSTNSYNQTYYDTTAAQRKI